MSFFCSVGSTSFQMLQSISSLTLCMLVTYNLRRTKKRLLGYNFVRGISYLIYYRLKKIYLKSGNIYPFIRLLIYSTNIF